MLDFEQEVPSIVQRCQGSPVIYEGLALRFANYDRLEGKVERVAKRCKALFLQQNPPLFAAVAVAANCNAVPLERHNAPMMPLQATLPKDKSVWRDAQWRI